MGVTSIEVTPTHLCTRWQWQVCSGVGAAAVVGCAALAGTTLACALAHDDLLYVWMWPHAATSLNHLILSHALVGGDLVPSGASWPVLDAQLSHASGVDGKVSGLIPGRWGTGRQLGESFSRVLC